MLVMPCTDAAPVSDRIPTGGAYHGSMLHIAAAGAKVVPRVNRIDLVYLYVSDFERSLRFYRDVIGVPLEQTGREGWAEATLEGGVRFAINQAAGYAPPTPRTADIGFQTTTLDSDRSALVSAGLQVTPIERGAWGDHFHVYDPDGYRLSFFTTDKPPTSVSALDTVGD